MFHGYLKIYEKSATQIELREHQQFSLRLTDLGRQGIGGGSGGYGEVG